MAVLFVGGMVILYLAARSYALTAADRSYDRLLAGSALSIAETLAITKQEVHVDIPYAALDMLSAAPDDRVFYRVFGPDRRRTATGYEDLPISEREMTLSRADSPEPLRFFDAAYAGERVRFALLGRRIVEPGVEGHVWVQVGQTRRAREALAAELVLGALAPIGLMTVLALTLVWFGIARALRPLERLSAELTRRDPADLTPVQAPVPKEIVPLVEALDGFMRRLRTTLDTMRAFIAEAAHQMRTPLAALRAQAQVTLEDADSDAATLRRSLASVERNAARLTRLLNQLLADATVAHRSDLRRFESFDLLRTMRRALRETVPQADGLVEIRFTSTVDSAPCVGDSLMIGEALANVLDNALRHGGAPGSGPIDVRFDEFEDGYRLTVADRGPGVPPADRERVFERFSRGEHERPGAGLGLAIVRHVMASHGGSVRLMDRDDAASGLQVELRVPREARH